MIPHDNEIRVFKIAVTTDALHQYAQFTVMFFQLKLRSIAVYAELMPNRIQIAHFDKHHIRLTVIANDIRRNCVCEVVQTAIEHLVAAAEQITIFPEITIQRIFTRNAFKELTRIIATITHRHTHGQIDIHIGARRNRPINQTG